MTTESLGEAGSLEALVSADVGVIHRVDAGLTGYDHPRLAPAFAQICDTSPVFGLAQAARAGGMATDPGHARRSAVGEGVERYSAMHLPQTRLRTATVEELAPTPLAPPDWLHRHAPHAAVRWVPGHRLNGAGPAEAAWLAASRVYLRGDDELGQIAIPTSTGLACHPDPWQALYAGLLEVIERDAIMVSWLTRSGARPLHTELRWVAATGNPVRFDRAVERYQLYLLDSPTHVPVVLATVFGAEQQPAVVVGGAADLDLGRACRRALIEAHQTFGWGALMLAQGRPVPADPAAIDDLDEHVAYYLDPARLPAFDYLRDADAPPLDVELGVLAPLGSAEQRCRRVVAAAEGAGLDCFVADVTSPDVRSAGLWVTRAVVPDLYPLLVGTRTAPDHPRVAPSIAAFREPHPFP